MKVYQQPIYNYRLECDLDPERSMEVVQSTFTNLLGNNYDKMLTTFKNYSIAALIILLVLPICSGPKASIASIPLTVLIVGGLLIVPLISTWRTANDFQDMVDNTELPTWLNDCID